MRNVLKGFLALSIVSAAFLGGFTSDTLRSAWRGRSGTLQQLELTPQRLASKLSRLTRPRAAFAQGEAALAPTETYYNTLETIRSYYVQQPTAPKARKDWSTQLKYAAISGMLAAIGDRYTEYWNPDEYRRSMEETSGRFSGIGARLDLTKDKKILIVEPIENSPAARAGILAGDIIAAVDGKPVFATPNDSLDSVIKRIRGLEGTKVVLTIERKGKPKPLVFPLIRAFVNSPIIEYRMQDAANKIGYIKLDMFNEEAAHQFDKALVKLEQQGVRALIFDLRYNPGGLLNIATDIASRFIKSGPVVWIQQKDGGMQSLDVDTKIRTKLHNGTYPVTVLVNGNSASASEIVSGAIQEAGAGILIGTRTYGKGLVQTIIPLNEGEGAVKITTQHYYTRDKHDINLKRDENGTPISGSGGINPDLLVELTEKDIEQQRNALRENPRDRAAAARFDPQMKRAMEVLRDRLAGKPFPPSEKDKPQTAAKERDAEIAPAQE